MKVERDITIEIDKIDEEQTYVGITINGNKSWASIESIPYIIKELNIVYDSYHPKDESTITIKKSSYNDLVNSCKSLVKIKSILRSDE